MHLTLEQIKSITQGAERIEQNIPLQEKFDELAIKTKAELWLYDGVHPTSAGHELIAREWLNYFKKFE